MYCLWAPLKICTSAPNPQFLFFHCLFLGKYVYPSKFTLRVSGLQYAAFFSCFIFMKNTNFPRLEYFEIKSSVSRLEGCVHNQSFKLHDNLCNIGRGCKQSINEANIINLRQITIRRNQQHTFGSLL